jgi:uncharacterized protein
MIISIIILIIFGTNFLIENVLPYSIIKPFRQPFGISANDILNRNRIKFEEYHIKTNDSIKLDLIYVHAKNFDTGKTVILLHGISANKEQCLNKSIAVSYWGYNSIIIDLRAHGKSEGKYCTFGYKEKYDIINIIDFISKKYGNDTKFAIWGTSLGGAIALQAMAIDKRITCGIIESTFADLKEIVKDYARNMFYLKCDHIVEKSLEKAANIACFNIDSLKPENSAKLITCPVLVIHGTNDARISINNGERIYANLNSEVKEFYPVKNADHLDVYKIGGEKYLNKIKTFLKNNF